MSDLTLSEIDRSSITPLQQLPGQEVLKSRRGIALTPSVRLGRQPYFVLSEPPPVKARNYHIERSYRENDLIFAATFWDKLLLPIERVVFFQLHSRTSKLLCQEGIASLVGYSVGGANFSLNLDNSGLSSIGEMNEHRLDAFRMISDICGQTNGRWTIGGSAVDSLGLDQNGPEKAISLRLLRSVPIVQEPKDIEAFLKWREDRAVERRRFLDEISRLSVEVAASEMPEAHLSEIMSSIERSAEDITRTAQESGLSVSFGDYDFTFAPEDYSFWQHTDGGLGYFSATFALTSSPFIASAVAGLRLAAPAFRLVKKNAQSLAIARKTAPFLAFGRVAYSEE